MPRSSPSRCRWKPDELLGHAGAALARDRPPQGSRGAGVSHAGLGEVAHQRADAGGLLPAAVARVPHPAAVHRDGHARGVRRARPGRRRRADGPGGGAAARHRAGAVPRRRAAPQEAAGTGSADARSAGGGAQETGPRGRAQAVPVLEAVTEGDREGMTQPQLQDLLEAGVHFGHQTRRWNPKMRRFIFAERSGIYIIDLQKTLRQIEAAQELLRGVVLKGEGILFVCTKKQLKNILQPEAQRCGAFWVTERWLGGTLTNFQTMKRQIKRLKELEQGSVEGEFENYTKKERIGVAEANKLGIPVVAIVDTNADPDPITVPIPGNDDAIRAVSLITGAIADVVAEARRQMPLHEPAEEGEGVTYSTETGVEAEAEGDKKKRPARRKRRPKPEAIAARLKTETEEAPAPAESSGGGEG